MKIIISHDVDHITVKEHLNDTILVKFLIRSKIELLSGKISIKEYGLRLKRIFQNKWQNINEIIDFNNQNSIPSTLFVGVNNGVGLNYSIELAREMIAQILSKGADCGVHGINYDTIEGIQKEYDLFEQISGLNNFGIRMHYLRNEESTIDNISKAGYIFDSTEFSNNNYRKVGNTVEFPLQIMEGYEILNGKRWQSRNTNEAVKSTITKINKLAEANIEYCSILFHDRYFDDSFLTFKEWYINIIKYCKIEGYEFINYRQAIAEIRSNIR